MHGDEGQRATGNDISLSFQSADKSGLPPAPQTKDSVYLKYQKQYSLKKQSL